MDLHEKATNRIAELEAEKARFVEAANRQVAGYECAILELKRLLADEPAVQPRSNGHATDTEVGPCQTSQA